MPKMKEEIRKEEILEKEGKLRTVRGVFSMFLKMSKEDWRELDHKLLRIGFGAVTFIAMALFWLYFLRSVTPA